MFQIHQFTEAVLATPHAAQPEARRRRRPCCVSLGLELLVANTALSTPSTPASARRCSSAWTASRNCPAWSPARRPCAAIRFERDAHHQARGLTLEVDDNIDESKPRPSAAAKVDKFSVSVNDLCRLRVRMARPTSTPSSGHAGHARQPVHLIKLRAPENRPTRRPTSQDTGEA